MLLRRISRIVRFCAMVVPLTLAFVPAGFCQAISGQPDQAGPSEAIEEIVVYGEKSLIQLRLEVHKAEDKVFAMFNSLNSDDEYDIHCYLEAPIGSHIKRRVCRANFVSKATSEEARQLLRGQPGVSAWTKTQHKNKLLQAEMEALVLERPEFLKVVNEYGEANQALKSERERRCEGRVSTCRK